MSEIKTLFRVSGDEFAQVNEVTRYTLFAEDDNGQPKDVNTNDLDAWLRGRSNIRGRIVRKDVGEYLVEFILTCELGAYHLDVTLHGRPIFRKGDVAIEVSEYSKKSKMNFEVEGQGLYGGRVGDRSEMTITVKEPTGRLFEIDPRALRVELRGPSRLEAQIGVESPGRYRATFIVDQPGEFELDVLYSGEKVLEKNKVKFSNRTNPGRSTLQNIPERVRSNIDVTFQIISKDHQGSRVWIGGDDWEATATGPERVNKLNIQDNDDGSYTLTTLLPLQGVYTFDVRCKGVAAGNSPVKIRCD